MSEAQRAMSEWVSRVVDKVTSGRWLMTVTASAMLVIMVVQQRIEPDAVLGIVGTIIGFYFGARQNATNIK